MTAPPLLHSKSFDGRVFAVRNEGGLVPSDRLYGVRVRPGIDERVVFGLLNSTLYAATLELWGRAEGGGALEVMAYEVGTIPVVDPRRLDEATLSAISRASDDLYDGVPGARERLDRVILDALGRADLSVAEIRRIRAVLAERRARASGEASLLVG